MLKNPKFRQDQQIVRIPGLSMGSNSNYTGILMNCRSIYSKLSEIKFLVYSTKYDIGALSVSYPYIHKQ